MASAKLSGSLLRYKELPSAMLAAQKLASSDVSPLPADRLAYADAELGGHDDPTAPEPELTSSQLSVDDRGWRIGQIICLGLAGCGIGMTIATALFFFLHSRGHTSPPTMVAAIPPALSTSQAETVTAEVPAQPQVAAAISAVLMAEPASETLSSAVDTSASATSSRSTHAFVPEEPTPVGTPVLLPANPRPTPDATASAPPTVAVAASPVPVTGTRLPPDELVALVARGDQLFGNGDIVMARLFYERAAEGGDAQAALRLGQTYDPAFLAQVGLRSVRGDRAAAARWYRYARALGAAEAEILLHSFLSVPDEASSGSVKSSPEPLIGTSDR
jgi:hypothetical protein